MLISRKQASCYANKKLGRPALTPKTREDQLIALATDVAEQKLRDGTASSQLITHYLRTPADRARNAIENEMLKKKKELMDAKIESLKSERRIEELYLNAVEAMRTYTGHGGDEEIEDDDPELY